MLSLDKSARYVVVIDKLGVEGTNVNGLSSLDPTMMLILPALCITFEVKL